MKKNVLFAVLAMAVLVGLAQAQPAEPYRLSFITLPFYDSLNPDIASYNAIIQM